MGLGLVRFRRVVRRVSRINGEIGEGERSVRELIRIVRETLEGTLEISCSRLYSGSCPHWSRTIPETEIRKTSFLVI